MIVHSDIVRKFNVIVHMWQDLWKSRIDRIPLVACQEAAHPHVSSWVLLPPCKCQSCTVWMVVTSVGYNSVDIFVCHPAVVPAKGRDGSITAVWTIVDL